MASEDTSAAEAKEASIEDASRVRADVRAFVMTHADHAWSGRAVARVFHGIGDDDDDINSVSLLLLGPKLMFAEHSLAGLGRLV